MVQLKDEDSDSAAKAKTKMRDGKGIPAWPAVLFAVAVALIATGVSYMTQSKTGCPFHFGKVGHKHAFKCIHFLKKLISRCTQTIPQNTGELLSIHFETVHHFLG